MSLSRFFSPSSGTAERCTQFAERNVNAPKANRGKLQDLCLIKPVDMGKREDQGPRLQRNLEHVSVLNSQSVLRNDVTSFALAC